MNLNLWKRQKEDNDSVRLSGIKQKYSRLSSRVLAFFKNNRKKEETRRSRFTREYLNCGQLARMISTQLCDKQLVRGLDTFETFWENHQLMFMDCIHTKMFDVFSPRTIQSQLKSQLNNWPRVLYFRKYFLIALR